MVPVAAVAATVALLLTPWVRRLAVAAGALDAPGERKVHRVAVPRWGGLAIFAGFWVAFGLFLLLDPRARTALSFANARFSREILGLALASVTVVLVGLADDRWGVPAKWKLAGQVLAAVMLATFDVRIFGFGNPFGGGWIALPAAVGFAVTVVWVTAIVNAVNFVDGLDGLAAGVAAIAAATFFAVAVSHEASLTRWIDQTHLYLAAALCAALFGAAVGFLRWNFHPASIFMGDTGSMLLGLLLAAATLMGTMKAAAVTVFVPALILAFPLFDVVLAVVRRSRRRVGLASADREHLHHRLLASGLSHRQAVIAVYLFCMILSLVAVILSR